MKEKLLHVSPDHRDGCRKLHISPIEQERRRWIQPTVEDRNLIQCISSFVSGLGGSDTPTVLAEKTVAAVREALPHMSCQFWFKGIGKARAKMIASWGKTSQSGNRFFRCYASEPTIKISTGGYAEPHNPTAVYIRIQTGPRADALVYFESPNGEVSEAELDYLTCLASIAEKRLPQLVQEPTVAGPGTGLSLKSSGILIGRHPRMQALFQQIRKIAPTECAVLILGESGTGKELVARAIHEYSRRQDEAFVVLNCGALHESLIESELFGYRQGSFTGADRDRQGLFESAHKGTLFLDEISSMPASLQTRFLRVLQEKKIRRIGDSNELPVDVRIVAASNQDMAKLVNCGDFRLDLYYRLKVVELQIPPLRCRMDDVPLLAEDFLSRLNKHNLRHKRFSPTALGLLRRHGFPGNVRELQHLVESVFFLSTGEELGPEDIEHSLGEIKLHGDNPDSPAKRLYRRLSDGKGDFWADVRDPFLNRDLCRMDVRELIDLALSAVGGNYRQVVRLLGLPDRDYRKLLNFLSHHDCKLDFRPYRQQAFA